MAAKDSLLFHFSNTVKRALVDPDEPRFAIQAIVQQAIRFSGLLEYASQIPVTQAGVKAIESDLSWRHHQCDRVFLRASISPWRAIGAD
jgi:hypothetical protein